MVNDAITKLPRLSRKHAWQLRRPRRRRHGADSSRRRHRGVLEVRKRFEKDAESAPSSQPPPRKTLCESGEQQTTRHGAADANGRSCGVWDTSATQSDAAPGKLTRQRPSETSHPTQPAVASIASFGTFGLTTARQSEGPKSSPARKRLGLETRSNSKKKPPTAIIPGNESRRWREGASTLQNVEIRTRKSI